MKRGWEVEFKDGKIITEDMMEWKGVPKKDIVRMTLRFDGREWNLIDKKGYLQKKRGSMVPGINGSFQVESRSIGYYEDDCKVWYTVNEFNGVMSMEIENI